MRRPWTMQWAKAYSSRVVKDSQHFPALPLVTKCRLRFSKNHNICWSLARRPLAIAKSLQQIMIKRDRSVRVSRDVSLIGAACACVFTICWVYHRIYQAVVEGLNL